MIVRFFFMLIALYFSVVIHAFTISVEAKNTINFFPARVKWFNKSKGYGFANIFRSSNDIFLQLKIFLTKRQKKFG